MRRRWEVKRKQKRKKERNEGKKDKRWKDAKRNQGEDKEDQ